MALAFFFLQFRNRTMTLSERINEDMKQALKAGRKLELSTLRTIRAGILEFEKQKVGTVLSDEDALQILTRAAKKRQEAIEQYTLGGRTDLVDQESAELEIINRYLPKPLEEAEVIALIRGVMEESGAGGMKDIGKVMGPVMKQIKGRFDGAKVQSLVREILGGTSGA